MLKKLRVKIVAAIMAISFAVLAVAFAAVMVVTSASAQLPLQRDLSNAIEWGPDDTVSFIIGRRDSPRSLEAQQLDGATGQENTQGREGGSLVPVAVAVVSQEDGSVTSYNDAFTSSMDEQTRTLAVAAALEARDDAGLLGDIGVFYLREKGTSDVAVAFVDASSYLSSMKSAAIGMAVVFSCALLALFALSVFLSRVITRPVQKAWDTQAQFVADASHELKTPLTVILANADILKSHPEDLGVEQRKWICGIHSEAQRMKQLVEEMLFLARNDDEMCASGRPAGETDLSAVVRQACLTFDAVAFEAGVELADAIEDKVWVHADLDQLERLVKSLVDNAVKYAQRGGRVEVSLAGGKKGHPVLWVTNTGEPIPPKDLPHVFDRFWRSEAARSESQNGSYGLGLAIAKSIAESQGARIAVASSAEAGTTFTVSF